MKRGGIVVFRNLGAILFVCFLPALLLASEGAPSLDRPHDPVVLSGDRLPRFLGEPLDRLRLMALRDGELQVVPFQIDERDGKGNYIFSHQFKRGKWKEPKPAEGQGVFSPQDELVFMAFDCGGRLPREKWPAADQAAEIRVSDPVRSGEGFVYLFSMMNPPPLSGKDYIRHDPNGRMILTDTYAFGFYDDPGGGVFDFVGFGDALHTSPEQLKNRDILDKLIFDFSVSFFFRGLKFSWDETDLNAGLSAHKAGPVRVLQKVWYSIDLVLGLKSPRMERTLFNYPGRTVIPTEMNVPFNPARFFSQSRVKIIFDFSSRISGSRMYHPQFDEPLFIDGRMSPLEETVEETEFVLRPDCPIWLAVGDGWGGIMGRVYPQPESWDIFMNMKGKGQTQLYYLDAETIRNPRENEPGSYGQIGGRFEGVGSVSKGKYSMLMIFFAKDHMDEEMIQRLLEVDDNPLITEVLN